MSFLSKVIRSSKVSRVRKKIRDLKVEQRALSSMLSKTEGFLKREERQKYLLVDADE